MKALIHLLMKKDCIQNKEAEWIKITWEAVTEETMGNNNNKKNFGSLNLNYFGYQ